METKLSFLIIKIVISEQVRKGFLKTEMLTSCSSCCRNCCINAVWHGVDQAVALGDKSSTWYLWQCGSVQSAAANEISICIKLVSRGKHEVL